MVGISIYPTKHPKESIIRYLNLCASLGYKRIYSSFLADGTHAKKDILNLQDIFAKAKAMGFEKIMVDVNQNILRQLKITSQHLDFFKDLNITGIRLDETDDWKTIQMLVQNKSRIAIELNMSSNEPCPETFKKHAIPLTNVCGCHNFYPQIYTGLSERFFQKQNTYYKNFKLSTACFITSLVAKDGPWPIMDGLPTLEMHRDLSPDLQAKHMWLLKNQIDDIIFGNALVPKTELQRVSKIFLNDKLALKAKIASTTSIEKAILNETNHFVRADLNEYLIRSTIGRIKYRDVPLKQWGKAKEFFDKGDIVICNDLSENYKGELQIILKKQKNINKRRNFVGQIDYKEMFLIDYLKPLDKFYFDL